MHTRESKGFQPHKNTVLIGQLRAENSTKIPQKEPIKININCTANPIKKVFEHAHLVILL